MGENPRARESLNTTYMSVTVQRGYAEQSSGYEPTADNSKSHPQISSAGHPQEWNRKKRRDLSQQFYSDSIISYL